MKRIFLLLTMTASLFSEGIAQISQIKVGVDGVTCSMCSKGTERSIKKLAFINNVVMDLNTTEAAITVKQGSQADFKAIAEAIKDAGFSVRYMKFTYTASAAGATTFSVGKVQYQVLGGTLKTGANDVALVGKDYMNEEEFKNWELRLPKAGIGSGPVYYLKVL
jgi:copper chaperone CopZ